MIIIKWHIIKSNRDLPKAGRYVLVTKIRHGKRVAGVDTPIPLKYYLGGRDPYADWNNIFEGERVIAWTELPEPYQGKLK